MASLNGLRAMLEGRPREPDAFDPATALARWKRWVEALYGDIEQWLSWLPEKGGSIERVPLTRDEESLGAYDIEGLLVTIDGREFFFDPRGKHVIGANGRVDLYEIGRVENSATLLYFTNNEDQPGTWAIQLRTDPRHRAPLSEETLDQLLGRMMSVQ